MILIVHLIIVHDYNNHLQMTAPINNILPNKQPVDGLDLMLIYCIIARCLALNRIVLESLNLLLIPNFCCLFHFISLRFVSHHIYRYIVSIQSNFKLHKNQNYKPNKNLQSKHSKSLTINAKKNQFKSQFLSKRTKYRMQRSKQSHILKSIFQNNKKCANSHAKHYSKYTSLSNRHEPKQKNKQTK